MAHKTCQRCGTQLRPDVPGGFCPRCLVQAGIDLNAGAAPDADASLGGAASPLATRHLPLAPSFGDYELLEEIARGGMGVVYKARQRSLNRLVALKMMLSGQFAQPEFVQRFRAEAQAIGHLQHPNIVAIHEVGEHEGQPYFSMDYVEGRTLAELVREGPLPAQRAATCLKAIAEAVHYAHQHGILHRDLKPSNVLIDASDQPRITDFGLAKRLAGDSELTLTGQVLGSPNYLSPEQAAGRQAEVGPASDVYALGAMLYHLVTGRPPFQADSLTTLLRQVMETEPVTPRLLNASVPRDLETVCLKCLEKDQPRRYATAQAVADELGRFLRNEPILARPVGLAGKAGRWCRRKPALAVALGAVVLVAAVGFVGVVTQWRRAEVQRQKAEAGEYAADMHLAQLALADNNRSLAVSLLDKHRPASSAPSTLNPQPSTDLRGWEWRYLWQLCRGDELFTLHKYPDSIRALAVSKDGTILALACGDEVALWNLTTKQPLTALPIATTEALAFSPSDNLLAVGTWNATGQPAIDLWDVSTNKVAKTLAHEAEVRSVAFSPDGKLLATFDNRGNIEVADWASDRTLTNFTVPPPRRRPIGVVVFSPDGNRLAIGEDYGQIRLLDLRNGTVLPLQTQSSEGVYALVFSANAQLLAASLGGDVRLWDAHSGEPRGQLTNFSGALAFTPDGRRLVAASADGTIRIWSVAEHTELRCLRSSGEGLAAMGMLPDGRTLATAGDEGSVCLWDTAASSRAPAHTNWAVALGFDSFVVPDAPSFMRETLGPAARRFGFTFTPDSQRFITTDPDGFLWVWNTRSAQPTEKLSALGSNHWGVALSPDGGWLAAGKTSGILTIWDWTARRAVTNLTVPYEWYGKLRFSRSGNFLYTVGFNNEWMATTRIWHTGDWKEIALAGNQLADSWWVDLSTDDRLLAAGYANGTVKLFRFPSGQHKTTFTNYQASVTGVLFSPDSQMVFSTSFDDCVRLWDVSARRELAPLEGHKGMVWSPALSPDGRRLATGGNGLRDAVKLWDLVAHRELLSLQGEGQYFIQLTFSPDGNALAAITFDGIAHLWRAPSWAEIEAAEKGGVTP